MIAERLALEKKYQEAERVEFWQRFEERFGSVGSDPVSYYDYEIGHILGVSPDQVSELTPADLMGAAVLFEAKYRV